MTVQKQGSNWLQSETPGCRRCHTDWDLDRTHVDGGHVEQGKVCITIQTYHLFGDVSDNSDPLWLLLTALNRRICTDRLEDLRDKYARGSIREMWITDQ